MPDILWEPEKPIMHRVEWATMINLSENGYEQRISDRERPHHFVEMDLRFDDLAELRNFRGFMFRNANATWRVPIWWEAHTLTSETSAGSDELVGSFANSDLAAGDTVVLFDLQDENAPHISTINSVTSSLITMDSGVGPTFPAGSQFFKLQDMLVAASPRWVRVDASFERLQLSMRYTTQQALGGANATVSTFQHSADEAAYSLLDRKPLSPADGSYDAFIDPIDLGKVFSHGSAIDPAAMFETRRYSIPTRDELQWWEKFLDTIVGAREPFYTPTYRPDLVVKSQPHGASSPAWGVFDVEDESEDETDANDYVGQYFPNSSQKQLRFATDQGEQYEEVADATDNADTSITLELAAGLTVNTVISQISFLERCRLLDVATFEHFGTRSTVTIGLKVIQRHPDEPPPQ